MPLTASQRVHLIVEIARRLGSEQWPIIDLTLSQFDLPIDRWGSDKQSYVFAMIEQAEDRSLLALSRHLGSHIRLDPAQSVADPQFWQTGALRLFVSHLARYRKFAGQLRDDLEQFGISAFVAHDDIEPTSEWQTQIELALATCDAMVALLHPAFHKSDWTDQEIGYAMGRGLLIATVRLGTDPYGFIGRFQALEGINKTTAELADELFGILRYQHRTRETMARAVVNSFAQSTSHRAAQRNMKLLRRLTYWDPSLSTIARRALEENDQLHDAHYIPQKLERFIRNMEERDEEQSS